MKTPGQQKRDEDWSTLGGQVVGGESLPPYGSAMWMCQICNHVMTEEQSKGYRGCPAGMHFAQHVPVELVPCPDCYGGHFRPCQMCGDTGMATRRLPNEKGQL